MNDKIIELIKQRLDVGKREYGEQLDVFDGRDWEKETLEELLDACVYLSSAILKLMLAKERKKMRATEFIDFINRDSLSDDFQYSHLEIKEEIEDNKGGVKFVIRKDYKKIRHDYRKDIDVKKATV